MTENKLNIIAVSNQSPPLHSSQNCQLHLKAMQAVFERLWLKDPEQFNPLRNCMERERLDRTWELLTKHILLTKQRTLDIGCASGVFSRRLRNAGASVEAVDIAENALKKFREIDADNIQLMQESMPSTTLPDNSYKVIICTELIAEIPKKDHRLFFVELSRLIQESGYLIFSSPVDIDSVDALERLKQLSQSEFEMIEERYSYHALYLRLKKFFKAPSLFIQSFENSDLRKKEVFHRRGLNKYWFWLNTTPLMMGTWYVLEPCVRPICKLFQDNHKVLLVLENISRFLFDREGISHYLFIAKKRPLLATAPGDSPIESSKRK